MTIVVGGLLTQMKGTQIIRAAILAGFTLIALQASAVLYDFDSLPNGVSGSGDVSGLTIETGSIATGAAVGDTITFSSPTSQFLVTGNFGAPADKIIYAGGSSDLLITPDQAFTAASVWSDAFDGGGEDVIRILGLVSTGNAYEYEVLDIDSGLDGLIQISVDGSTFDALILECTTEQEGFNDLELTPVPDPATIATLGVGLAMMRKRRKS